MEYCFNYCKPSIYITGDALPHFRGVLHLIVTFLIPIVFIIIVCIQKLIQIWPLLIFLGGKLFSYGSSALLHTGIAKDKDTHLFLLFIDKVGVYISVFVTGIPFFVQSNVLLYYGISYLLLFGGVISLIYNYEFLRIIIFIIQLIFTISLIGYQLQWNVLWIIGTLLYITCFVIFLPCVIKTNTSNSREMFDVCLRDVCLWHKPGRNGCHEDFHTFLFFADIVFFINAYIYLFRE